MEWDSVVAMRADRDGRITRLEPAPSASPVIASKVAQATARAFACRMSGGLAIHASAVARDGVAIACLGDSGAGKSTAARELCGRADLQLLADDVLGVRRDAGIWRAHPTEQIHWIFDGADVKRAFPARSPATGPARLSRAVLLRFDEACVSPRLRPLRGSEAFQGLLEGSLRFDRSIPACREEIDMLADLAAAVPFDELSRARGTPCSEVADRLAALLEGRGDVE
jgi:hypothetical protein